MSSETHNVIIIGSGPAGYSAGLYAARAGLSPLLFEGSLSTENIYIGGQLTTTSVVENYLGMDGMHGLEMADKFKDHAVKYGLNVLSRTIISVNVDKETKLITLVDNENDQYVCKSLIIATGAMAKKLGMPGEEKFWHYGISACAVCDGSLPMFKKNPIAVVGGGDSAFEEAMYLSKFGSHIYLIHRSDKFRASKIMMKRAAENKKITILCNTEVLEACGDNRLRYLRLKNKISGEETQLDVNGLFYGIGHVPNTSFLKDSGVEITDDGYVLTKDNVFTNISGIYAAGDVQDKRYRQAITSAGTGCMAALEVEKYLESFE